MEIARISRGKIELDRRPLALADIVRDNGRGIPAAQLARVFDMFAQPHLGTGGDGDGLGIGLAIVRKLVEMHEGTVRAHSAGPGLGSEFVVRRPLLQGAALAVLPAFAPDVVLLGLGMPDMDGFDAALTGWGQQADRARTRAAGFDHHLTKPVDLAGLAAWLGGG